jgi:hypothetical protein
MLVSAIVAATLAMSAQQTAAPRQSLTISRAGGPPRLEDFRTGERRDGMRSTA